MSFFPLIVTIIAIILDTSIIDIEAGLLAALISLQWVSGKEFRQGIQASTHVFDQSCLLPQYWQLRNQ
jgi:hypothetical protein